MITRALALFVLVAGCASNDSSPDLSMPDLAVPRDLLLSYGCNQYLLCRSDCTPGDNACAAECNGPLSTSGRNILNALIECEVNACGSADAAPFQCTAAELAGLQDLNTKPDISGDCYSCINTATVPMGQCRAALVACTSDVS